MIHSLNVTSDKFEWLLIQNKHFAHTLKLGWPEISILGTAQMDCGPWGLDSLLKIQIKHGPEERPT